jgi:aminobenzoyl-glutamate transport protein
MSDSAGWLGHLEALGNRLPDPATLFVIGALGVMALSQVAVSCGWSAEKTVSREVRAPVRGPDGGPVIDPASGVPLTLPVLDPASGTPRHELASERVEAVSLLSSDGLFWAIRSLVDNFKDFPPLAIVLVGMLGIGLAERAGFLPALLKASLLRVPEALLTPLLFFVGVMSSIALDAGYVVLPPIAAALYRSVGRSPLVGLAVVFAGVSAGFGANLVITGLEPILAGLSTAGAQVIDPHYTVVASANWSFIAVSTVVLTGVGWAVTAGFVEPRWGRRPPAEGGPDPSATVQPAERQLTDPERRGLARGLAVLALALALVLAATLVPGAPLQGEAGKFPRWVDAIVPLLFLTFLLPGLAYGAAAGSLRSDRDVARMLGETMASMGPYIVLAFFAAQFIAYFTHSRLGEMLAIHGGEWLVRAALPAPLLMTAFVVVVGLANLLIGSMSAKYAFFAPVFVPMFMRVGISPELTQAAYRVGDSVTNVITPLNPYLIIILVLVQRYVPRAGIGTLVAMMLPYALAMGVAWTALLVGWMALGIPLGPGGPLVYLPALGGHP